MLSGVRSMKPDDGLVAAMDKADRGDPEQIALVVLNFDYDLPRLARYYLSNLVARGCVPVNRGQLPPLSKPARSRLRDDQVAARIAPYRPSERRILADAIQRGIRRPSPHRPTWPITRAYPKRCSGWRRSEYVTTPVFMQSLA